MEIIVQSGGIVRCIYSEELDLSKLGRPTITRASHVEPTDDGRWIADLEPVDGPALGPYRQRSQALVAEAHWLSVNWLTQTT